jgi:hypothetical protein
VEVRQRATRKEARVDRTAVLEVTRGFAAELAAR